MSHKPAPAVTPAISVLLVEDHPGLRLTIRHLVENDPAYRVSAFASPEQALAAVAQHPPKLAIVDLALGGANGLDLIESLRRQLPDLPILVLSMHSEAMYARHALRAGANGYLMKDQAIEHLHEALGTVRRGKRWLSAAFRDDTSV